MIHRPIAALALALLLGSTAVAQDAPETPDAPAEESTPNADAEARRLFDNGAELYEEGRYEQSILAFREAYALSSRHTLLKNIASAQERMGELKAAVDTLNQYRVWAVDAEKDTISTRIRVLEGRIDEQKKKEEALAAARPPMPAPAAPPTEVQTTKPNPIKWVLLGSGTAVAAGFGAATFVSYDNGGNARDAGDQTAYDNARTLNSVSGALTILGGGVAAIGIALPTSRTVSIAPTSGGLRFAGRF